MSPQSDAGMRIDPPPSVAERRGGAPARSAGRVVAVPRVARDAGEQAGGVALDCELRERRLADDDRSGVDQSSGHHAVGRGGRGVRHRERALPGRVAPPVLEVLDQRRHPQQRTRRLLAPVDARGLFERFVVRLLGEDVEYCGLFEAFYGFADERGGGQPPFADGPGEVGERTERSRHLSQ